MNIPERLKYLSDILVDEFQCKVERFDTSAETAFLRLIPPHIEGVTEQMEYIEIIDEKVVRGHFTIHVERLETFDTYYVEINTTLGIIKIIEEILNGKE